MKKKKIVRKTFEQYNGDWPKLDASSFIDWFQSKIADVPDESRYSLTIDIDSSDSGYATIEFVYTRTETDDEEAIRELTDLSRESLIREQELKDLKRLQAKYGNLDDKS
jgi:hypothetical protein